VVTLGNGITEADLIVHDVTNPIMAQMLAHLNYPEFPVPMGILYQVARGTYEDLLTAKVEQQVAQKGPGDLRQLLYSGQIWEIGDTQVNQDLDQDDDFDLEEIDILPEAPKENGQKNLMEESISVLAPPQALTVSPTDSVAEAIRLMQEKNYGCVHVREGETLVGIFTDDDILNKIIGYELDLESLPVSQMMRLNPVCVDLKDTLAFAFNKMVIAGNHHLPVLDEGKPVGFTSARGLLAYIGGHLKK